MHDLFTHLKKKPHASKHANDPQQTRSKQAKTRQGRKIARQPANSRTRNPRKSGEAAALMSPQCHWNLPGHPGCPAYYRIPKGQKRTTQSVYHPFDVYGAVRCERGVQGRLHQRAISRSPQSPIGPCRLSRRSCQKGMASCSYSDDEETDEQHRPQVANRGQLVPCEAWNVFL